MREVKLPSSALSLLEELQKSQVAEWLKQASQWHKIYCHDLEVMSSSPGQVELGLRDTSAPKLYLNQK